MAAIYDEKIEWAETQMVDMKSRNVIRKLEHEACSFPHIKNFKAEREASMRVAIDKINRAGRNYEDAEEDA
jgi:hemerythrin superfamily protein